MIASRNRTSPHSLVSIARFAGFLCLLGAQATIGAKADTFTYADSTFAPANWWFTADGLGNGGNYGTVTASQQLTGGNTGSYLENILHINAAIPGSFSADIGLNIASAFTYDPRTHGAISNIHFSVDGRIHPGALGVAGNYLILKQGGSIYFDPAGFANSSAWTTYSFNNLTSSSFGYYQQNRPYIPVSIFDMSQHPDFSKYGSAIQFGIAISNANDYFGGSYDNAADIDNFSVSVSTLVTPEPGVNGLFAAMVLSAGAALFRQKRRRIA